MSVAIGDVVAVAEIHDVFVAKLLGTGAGAVPLKVDHAFGMCAEGKHEMFIGHEVNVDGSEYVRADGGPSLSVLFEAGEPIGEIEGTNIYPYDSSTGIIETENVPVILAGAGLLTLVVEDAVDTAWLAEMEREYNSEELAELEQEFDDELFTELGSLFVGETSADDNEE